jgi:hypothetical protein
MMTVEHGRLIEAGFAAFARAQQPLHPDLITDLRIAFYAGAQHMFSSMVAIARDPRHQLSVTTIEAELKQFADECVLHAMPPAGNA